MEEKNQATAAMKNVEQSKVKLSKKDLLKCFAIWEWTSESCLNFERLMAQGFCHCMTPILKKLYPKKDDLAAGLTRHMAFFNTENNWGALIPGMVCSMEEERANGADITDEAIDGLKTGLMGPLAGVGDTITQGLVKPILMGIGIDLALKGNVLGPIAFFVLYTCYLLCVGYNMFFTGYKMGKNAFSNLAGTNIMRRLTDCMSILGLTVAGAMVATHVNIVTCSKISFKDTVVEIQPLLDQIMPGLLSVTAVLVIYKCLRKGTSVVKIMLSLLAIGLVGAVLGIL